jgi:calcineurin-like phosphoesterase family protein
MSTPEFESRPDNFSQLIVDNWNSIVKDDDIVICLGDFALTGNDRLKNYISVLNGKKILVKGNHDRHNIQWCMNNGFSFLCQTFSMRISSYNILFSHRPQANIEGYDMNIHGHLHSKFYCVPDDKKHFLFSLEYENYMPVEINQFIEKHKKLVKKYPLMGKNEKL